jgi:hypothetical protein
VTSLVTDLAAKQPLDSDLTTLAGLTATTDNFIVSASSAWASRTPAQAKTSLALVKADVGLGNLDNTSDANKPVSSATQTALNLKANLAAPSFTGNVTISANNLITDTVTGMQIATGATQKLGFFGVTPAVRPTALTQTYATASATHAAVTQLVAPAGGTGVAAGGWSTAANRDLSITSINAARTDIANLKNFVNQIVDQLQALGLLQ